MSFARPDALLLLWALPLWLGFALWSLRRRERDIARFAQSGVVDAVRPVAMRGGRRWQMFWWTVAAVFFVVALAQPRLGFEWRELEQKGVDLVILLDVSTSMNAEDVSPNRMERARREVRDILAHAPSDRIGLVIFAAGAYPRLPLTLDHDALAMVLRTTSPKTLRAQGSAIEAAIDAGVEMLVMGGGGGGALVLISDGETSEGDAVEAAAERALAAGVSIYSLLVGTDAGAPIPIPGGGFKKTRSGEVVVSRATPGVLQRVSQITGGAMARSVPGDADTRALVLDEIHRNIEGSTQQVRRERVWNERFQAPLFLGLIALFLAGLSAGRPRTMAPQVGWAALLLLGVMPARAQQGKGVEAPGPGTSESTELRQALRERAEDPDDPYRAMELAEALYKAGRFDEAQAAWKTVAQRGPDTTLQTRARYNMGNAAYQGGRLADAIASYQSALELDPAFEAAKANASAVSEELQKRMLPPDASQSEKDGDSEPEESDPASSDQERAPDSSDGTRSEAPQDDTPQSAAVDTGASEQDPGSGEQDPSAGEQDPGDPISYAAGESTPKQLSAEQARRLLDAVDEGVPHVVVGGNVDGAQDW